MQGMFTDTILSCENFRSSKTIPFLLKESHVSIKLQVLLRNTWCLSPLSGEFIKNNRSYNNLFSMTSLGCNRVTYNGYNTLFKVSGQMNHWIGSIYPTNNQVPKFLQVYIGFMAKTKVNWIRYGLFFWVKMKIFVL